MFRFRPATPLAQKTHPIAQPTCVEMHWVTRFFVVAAAPASSTSSIVVERRRVGVVAGRPIGIDGGRAIRRARA